MKKYVGLFMRTIGLGFGIGLCLAGAVGILYRVVHGGDQNFRAGNVNVYFFVVGGMMGLLGGWCLSLYVILGELMSALFVKISSLVPIPAAKVGAEWAEKMAEVFRHVLKPLPSLFRGLLDRFLILRFRNYEKINQAVEKAKKKNSSGAFSPEWLSQAVLEYFLFPLRVFFYLACVILFLICCLFWSLPFFK